MGKSSNESSKTEFTLCKYEAANLLCQQNTYIISHQMEGDATLYQSKQTQKVILESSMYPIYAQILEMEA